MKNAGRAKKEANVPLIKVDPNNENPDMSLGRKENKDSSAILNNRGKGYERFTN